MSLYSEVPQPTIIQGGGGTGSGTVAAVGTFSTASQVNGASISGSSVIFGPADTTNPGMVSTSAQSIAGPKTYNSIGTYSVPNLVLGTNANIAVTDSSSAFIARSTAVDCTAVGGGNVFNRLTSGNLNTSFGWGNMTGIITGANNTIIGVGGMTGLTGGVGNIGIGYVPLASLTNGTENIAIGTNSASNLSTGSGNIIVGFTASQGVNGVSTGAHNIAIGAFTLSSGAIGNSNICLGYSANIQSTTASNQLVIGGSSGGAGVTNGYFGNGVFNAAPQAFAFNATGGSGNDVAGANLILAGGRGTGAALGGQILFQTTVATSTGAIVNPLGNAMSIDGNANVAIGIGAIASSANNGFLYIPSCTGKPTGTPTAKAGLVPMVFEASSTKLFVFTGGSWKGAVFA